MKEMRVEMISDIIISFFKKGVMKTKLYRYEIRNAE